MPRLQARRTQTLNTLVIVTVLASASGCSDDSDAVDQTDGNGDLATGNTIGTTTGGSGTSDTMNATSSSDAGTSTSDTGVDCGGAAVLCAGTCIDPASNSSFCGASGDCQGPNAGQTCGAREVCEAGQCTQHLAWSPSVVISDSSVFGDAAGPRIGVAPDGTVTAVWKQYDDATQTTRSIWSNRYRPASRTWGLATVIEQEPGTADQVELVVDRQGFATAVWEQMNGDRLQLWSSRLPPHSDAWGLRTAVESSASGNTSYTENGLVVGPSGIITTTWIHSPLDTSHQDIWSNRFDPSAGVWGTMTMLETNADDRAYPCVLAGGPGGRVTAMWAQDRTVPVLSKALQSAIMSDGGSSWSSPGDVHAVEGQRTGNTAIVTAASGVSTALWSSYSNDTDGVQHIDLSWSRTDSGGNNWSPPQLAELMPGDASLPELVVDQLGTVTATWRQIDVDIDYLWSSRLLAGASAWTPAQLVGPKSIGAAHRHKLVVDGQGVVTVAWSAKPADVYNLWSARQDPVTGEWQDHVQIATSAAGSAFVGGLGVDANEDLILVWRQDGGTHPTIMSARYEPQAAH